MKTFWRICNSVDQFAKCKAQKQFCLIYPGCLWINNKKECNTITASTLLSTALCYRISFNTSEESGATVSNQLIHEAFFPANFEVMG